MRKFIYSLFFISLLAALAYPYLKKAALDKIVSAKFASSPKITKSQSSDTVKIIKKEKRFERIGEKIVYTIKLGKVNLGQAVFMSLPPVQLEGREVNLLTFETKLVRFRDLEKIYSDRDSFLPLKVERSISNWPISEQINEYYDQDKFTLTIVKNNGRKDDPLIIKKDSIIHNAIMLPFYVRTRPKLDTGWLMTINLPNQRFEIKLLGIENINLPAGDFKAYRFESNPKRFEIWISADERRIPLKIKGSGLLGYIFVIKEYSISTKSGI